jgi:hypothetical protein
MREIVLLEPLFEVIAEEAKTLILAHPHEPICAEEASAREYTLQGFGEP